MNTHTSRRALIGGAGLAAIVASVPAAASTFPAVASNSNADPVWSKLVADFREGYAAWLATINLEDDAGESLFNARASLPPEPTKPGAASGDDILDKTLRELRDACDTPEHKAAWTDYERDHAAWKVQHDALHEQIVAPATAIHDRAFAIRSTAFNALTTYRVTNLCDLCEKIEIISKDYEGDGVPLEYVADILADVRHLAGGA